MPEILDFEEIEINPEQYLNNAKPATIDNELDLLHGHGFPSNLSIIDTIDDIYVDDIEANYTPNTRKSLHKSPINQSYEHKDGDRSPRKAQQEQRRKSNFQEDERFEHFQQFSDDEEDNRHRNHTSGANYNHNNDDYINEAGETHQLNPDGGDNQENDGAENANRNGKTSSFRLISKHEFSFHLKFLQKQKAWVAKAARKSSIGFNAQFPSNPKDILDKFLVLLTKGVLVRRHQRHKLSEMIKLSSSNGCRDIEWAKPLPEDLLLSKIYGQNGRNHNESSNNLLNGLQNHQNHNNYVTRDGQTIEIYKQQPGSSSARNGATAGTVGNANDLSIFHCFIASKFLKVCQFVRFLTHFPLFLCFPRTISF